MNENIKKISIGGIGGSGTRAVAELFIQMGYFMGSDLNSANDNLLYTLLFKRKDILVLSKNELYNRLEFFYKYMSESYTPNNHEKVWLHQLAKNENIQHDKAWLDERVEQCIKIKNNISLQWGWKEPNTHIIIDKILEFDSQMKFIYVYRNGLDMAYSSNQNQLQFWGDIFLNKHQISINQQNSLSYWCAVHKRMLMLQKVFPGRIYMLDLDDLCINPAEGLNEIFDFLDITIFENYEAIFKQPSSTNRYKEFGLEHFNVDDLAFLEKVYKGKK